MRNYPRLQKCLGLLMLLILAACDRGRGFESIPTVASVDALATESFLTQNAPPPGFRDPLAFPLIDAGLNELPGWRYEVLMEFAGVFARTTRQTTASTRAEVWFNQLGSARRVVVEASGELLGQETDNKYEAVRLGTDAYLVANNVCSRGEAAQRAADLSAGALIGGVKRAVNASQKATINGEAVWRYDFMTDELNLPQIELREGGRITFASGELWVAPKHNAVVRYYVNLEIENVAIFGSQLPVTGQVIIRYDLYEVGVAPNISVPFGCTP